jgi:Flp pilus assembly protein TadG
MRSRRIAAARDERGQSLIEVALLMPLLLLIVLGIVDVGRAFAVKGAATNAAREAAQYAARDPQALAENICQRAMVELANGTGAGACTLDLVASTPSNEIWRSATPAATVVCNRIPTILSASPRPCGNDPQPRLFQTDGEAGSTVTVAVTTQVTLLSFYFGPFGLRAVPVGASATWRGLSQ